MRIPYSKIVWYAERMDLTESETEKFIFIIKGLDNWHLNKLYEERKADLKNA
jgi:hypothetical protein